MGFFCDAGQMELSLMQRAKLKHTKPLINHMAKASAQSLRVTKSTLKAVNLGKLVGPKFTCRCAGNNLARMLKSMMCSGKDSEMLNALYSIWHIYFDLQLT